MKIFALSDLHLSFAVPDKSMAVFGDHWVDHAGKMARAWKERVEPGDLVLVAGDISWAMKPFQALPDLEYIARLPGRKVLIRGNHDYWWASAAKVRSLLPPTLHILSNDALTVDGVSFGGARLWDDHELAPIRLPQRPGRSGAEGLQDKLAGAMRSRFDPEKDEKLFQRELIRLEMSLSCMDRESALRIALVHYPPVSTTLEESRASRLLEAASIDHCVFGHLHNLLSPSGSAFFGRVGGVDFHLTSCDYLDFTPALIAEI